MKYWRLIYLTIPLTVLVFAGIAIWNGRTAGEEPAEGIGRVPTVRRYAASAQEEEIPSLPAYDEYTEGEGEAPAWWDPEEPMAAEWESETYNKLTTNLQSDSEDYNTRYDIGCPDWNFDTTLYGWDGHTAEPWELDLYARVFYLEFWGTSFECSQAGADAILNLWDTGKYGRTLFDSLSYYDPDYGYTYRVYPHVWETEYDPDGLAWCREFTAERFYHGPEWDCVYFQLYGFHDPSWTVPLYKLDTVYFSGAKGWQ